MSLDWNISDVENWKELHEDEEQWSMTEALIWRSLAIELGGITHKNYREFYQRLLVTDVIYGPAFFTWKKGEEKESAIKLSDIKRRIGLRTNVSNKTTKQFEKHIGEIMMQRALDTMRYEAAKLDHEEHKEDYAT